MTRGAFFQESSQTDVLPSHTGARRSSWKFSLVKTTAYFKDGAILLYSKMASRNPDALQMQTIYTTRRKKRVLSSLRVIGVFENLHPECMGFGSAVSEDALCYNSARRNSNH